MKSIKISGRVIKGEGYGKILGFPTANLERRSYSQLRKKPKLGVWAGHASYKLKAKSYKLKAAIVIGPMDKQKLPKIEAHLIDFKANLYGKKIFIVLQKYLRPWKNFKNENELKKQIKKDIQKTAIHIYK